jgi:hypothetical protein
MRNGRRMKKEKIIHRVSGDLLIWLGQRQFRRVLIKLGSSTLVQIRIWNCEEEKAEHLIA